MFESESELLNSVQLFETPWIVAYPAPQSMGFSSQKYWSGLPFPSSIKCLVGLKIKSTSTKLFSALKKKKKKNTGVGYHALLLRIFSLSSVLCLEFSFPKHLLG